MAITHTEALWAVYGGTVGVVAAGAWAYSTETFRETATRAEGRVTELVKSWDNSGDGPTYAPRFEYKTPNGELWSVLSKIGTSPAGFEVGDRVKVLYKVEDPAHARIDSISQLWEGPAVAGGVAVVAMVVGLIFLFNE